MSNCTKCATKRLTIFKRYRILQKNRLQIADAVQKKLSNHLWYLNEANIGLAFFDDNVDIEEKKEIILNLKK